MYSSVLVCVCVCMHVFMWRKHRKQVFGQEERNVQTQRAPSVSQDVTAGCILPFYCSLNHWQLSYVWWRKADVLKLDTRHTWCNCSDSSSERTRYERRGMKKWQNAKLWGSSVNSRGNGECMSTLLAKWDHDCGIRHTVSSYGCKPEGVTTKKDMSFIISSERQEAGARISRKRQNTGVGCRADRGFIKKFV